MPRTGRDIPRVPSRRDVTCVLTGLALLLTAAVAVEIGPGMTAGAADIQVIQPDPPTSSLQAS